jgi:CIC family chloride channel protein
MNISSPQPNMVAEENTHRLPPVFWALLGLTGIGTGLGAAGLMWILRTVQHSFWSYKAGDFLSAVEQVTHLHRVVVLAIGGTVAGIGLLLRKYAIGGHGGAVADAIWFKEGQFPFIRTTFSAVLSILIVGLGASLGREGAPKQVGAAIASKLSDWFGLSHPQRRLLAACGVGAGMGAVYNVPLGGALFAMEVLLGTLAFPMVLPAVLTSLIATAVAWIYLPTHATYVVSSFHIHGSEVAWALIFGPVAGLASVVYVRGIVWADRAKPKGWRMLYGPVLVFTMLGLLAIWYPQLLGNGKDTAQLAFDNVLDWKLLLTLMVLKLAATAGCLRSGAPGGLFTPTVTFGALLGGLCGHLWSYLPWSTHSGSYAIVGAGAVLAASTQGPISAIVLLIELTYHINGVVVPLMLAVAGATVTANWLEPRSIYTAKVRLGKLSAQKRPSSTNEALTDILVRDFSIVSAAEHYSAVLKALLSSHSPFVYVVDDEGRYAGVISANRAIDPEIQGPLDTTTASDLADYITPLATITDPTEAQKILHASPHPELPVIDEKTRRIAGILQRQSR